MTSAVEIYNKPAFPYREETFAILALNAWELLLKAKILKDGENDLRSIRVYEPRKLKSGAPSKKLYLKKNRAGNYQTLSLGQCLKVLTGTKSRPALELKTNITAINAIRDNSVHYITASSVLARQVQEIASACVHNFVLVNKEWFDRNLGNTLSLVLPISFAGTNSNIAPVISPDEDRLIRHLQSLAATDVKNPTDYSIALHLKVKFEKTSMPTLGKVRITRDPSALAVTLSEEDIREQFPWDYRELCKQMAKRFSDFKQDAKFHGLRKPLMSDTRYCKPRYLDPGNNRSPKKDFYNPNILQALEGSYVKKIA